MSESEIEGKETNEEETKNEGKIEGKKDTPKSGETREKKEEEKPKEKNARTYIEFFVETFFRGLFFWETDSKRLGRMIRFFHHSFMFILLILFLFTHTAAPYYSYLCALWLVWLCIWIHHIVCGGCIVSQIEQRLLEDDKSFVDPFLDMFHIPINTNTTRGITIMGSSLLLLFLSLEICSRSVLTLHSWISYFRLK